jgi:hypothetical protein
MQSVLSALLLALPASFVKRSFGRVSTYHE